MARREFQRRQQRGQRSRERRVEQQQQRDESIKARAQRESAQRRGKFLVRFAWAAGGVLLAGIVLWAILYSILRPQPGQEVVSLGGMHVPDLTTEHAPYNSTPPTSGPHLGTIAQPNIYTQQLPDELQVHNLEDGFVAVQYDCPEGCPELVQGLEEIVRPYLEDRRGILLAPYQGIQSLEGEPKRISLTAWTRIDTLDDVDAGRVRAFIDAYEGVDHHVE